MIRNIGPADRILRLALAAAILVLYLAKILSGAAGAALLALAGVLVATSLVRTCPLYLPFGIRTNGKEGKHAT